MELENWKWNQTVHKMEVQKYLHSLNSKLFFFNMFTNWPQWQILNIITKQSSSSVKFQNEVIYLETSHNIQISLQQKQNTNS